MPYLRDCQFELHIEITQGEYLLGTPESKVAGRMMRRLGFKTKYSVLPSFHSGSYFKEAALREHCGVETIWTQYT